MIQIIDMASMRRLLIQKCYQNVRRGLTAIYQISIGKTKRGSKLASNSEQPQTTIVYAICKICGILEPQEGLEDGTCEHCISGESQITVADISRLQGSAVQDRKTSNKRYRKSLSFIYFWLGAGVSIYLGIQISSEYQSNWAF